MVEIIGASGQAELKAQEKVSSLTKTLREDTGKAVLVCQGNIASSCKGRSVFIAPSPTFSPCSFLSYGLVSAYSFSSLPLELMELAIERILFPGWSCVSGALSLPDSEGLKA